MNKIFVSILVLIIFIGCTKNKSDFAQESQRIAGEAEIVTDSLLYFRHHNQETDILSRRFPEISREEAISIQLAMLRKELESGARQVGWKMGGTVADDSVNYDPMFGYILDSHIIDEDSLISTDNFPGGRTMVEGEVGFVLNKDFKDGVSSVEELKEGIDYVINAVEFAQDIAIPVNGHPETKNIHHTLAAGMGHAGLIIGSGRAEIEEFQVNSEVAKCLIDEKLAAEGISSNIYGGPLNALYSLANLLPRYGSYLKEGDVVVTGSVYENPTVDSTANVRLEFNTLGNINFYME